MQGVLLILVVCLLSCYGEEEAPPSDFAFPETSHQRLDENNDNKRVPLFIPGRCPDNQLLYPGDQEADWICDCAPGYVYYPARDACFAAFRQGPCQENTYLVLFKPDVIPKCVPNPCRADGKVKYKGICHQLGQAGGPCAPIQEGGGIFGVNSTTLQVECLKGTDPLSLITVPVNCPPGSIRDRRNRCREVFK